MGRSLCILLLVLSALMGSAQSGTVRGVVLDSADGRAVDEAQLGWVGEGISVVTDAEGRFTISVRNAEAMLEVTHVAYRTQRIVFKGSQSLTDGRWVIWLGARTILLDPAEVRRPKPEVIYQRKDLHAADLFINTEGLWVLAYEHPRMVRSEAEQGLEILRDVRLVLLDTQLVEQASAPLNEDVLGLYHDLRGMPIVRGTRLAYGVTRVAEDLLLSPFPLEQLERAVLPWTDSIPQWVLGSRKDDILPQVDHVGLAPALDSTALVASVVDPLMMELFRSEYKYMSGRDKVIAMDLARELKLDKQVVAGYMSGFDRNIWFRPVYAPLFVVGDTVLVFDHYRNRLRKYDLAFRPVGEAPLAHHLSKQGRDWKGRLLQDARTGDIYAEYQRFGQGWLQRVDPHTGAPGAITRLQYRYPEKVQVFNGEVYYIQRPQGSLQKRTIYRERVR
jgi:hypothetical protein